MKLTSPSRRRGPTSILLAAIFVGLLAVVVYLTHAVVPQALLFPGMLVFGTVMDSTTSNTFYILSAVTDILLYAAVIYFVLWLFRPRNSR